MEAVEIRRQIARLKELPGPLMTPEQAAVLLPALEAKLQELIALLLAPPKGARLSRLQYRLHAAMCEAMLRVVALASEHAETIRPGRLH